MQQLDRPLARAETRTTLASAPRIGKPLLGLGDRFSKNISKESGGVGVDSPYSAIRRSARDSASSSDVEVAQSDSTQSKPAVHERVSHRTPSPNPHLKKSQSASTAVSDHTP